MSIPAVPVSFGDVFDDSVICARSSNSPHAAVDYSLRGWPVLPMLPGTKRPYVTWKEHRGRCGAFEQPQIVQWFFSEFQDAGVALMLGPASGVVAIDIDGEEPFRAFVSAIGTIPRTPAVKSGNPDPFRQQYLFRLPEGLNTQATISPLCEGLEFRGDGGLSVLPPSLHASGRRYFWLPGLSPDEVPLAELPSEIATTWETAMQPRIRRRRPPAPEALPVESVAAVPTIPDQAAGIFSRCSRATKHFLLGLFADEMGWNQRLFYAACDLAGNGVPQTIATEYLIAGARPWNDEEVKKALCTIESAYSQPRVAATVWGLRQSVFPRSPR